MPSHFARDCPHCLSKSAAFQVTHKWADRNKRSMASILGICGVCNNGIILQFRNSRGAGATNYTAANLEFPVNDDRVFQEYPRMALEIPSDCPAPVERFYTQGLVNLKGANWDAAGAMFRKSLDVATKIMSPDGKNDNLFNRINKLVAKGMLTPSVGEWSHEIRIDGNDAVHDEEPETEEDANVMQKFTEAFLRYSFTLPSLVATNRTKR